MMEFIRGTTPSIEITVKTEIDLYQVAEVWLYIAQQNTVKVDKKLNDVTFDYEHRKMTILLSQEDTLNLKAGQEAIFQIRMLLLDETAIATNGERVNIREVYKDGVIRVEE